MPNADYKEEKQSSSAQSTPSGTPQSSPKQKRRYAGSTLMLFYWWKTFRLSMCVFFLGCVSGAGSAARAQWPPSQAQSSAPALAPAWIWDQARDLWSAGAFLDPGLRSTSPSLTLEQTKVQQVHPQHMSTHLESLCVALEANEVLLCKIHELIRSCWFQ